MSDIHAPDLPADADAHGDEGHDLLHELIGLVDPGADAPVPPGMPGMPGAELPVAPGGADAPVAPEPEVHLPVAEDPPPADPAPVDPPVDVAPVDPAPVDVAPVDPPVDVAPVDPAPVDPAPVDPAPVDPAPVDPAPVDVAPPTATSDGHDVTIPEQPVDDHNATTGDPVPTMVDHSAVDVPSAPDVPTGDTISLPVDATPADLPDTITNAIAPAADLHAVTASLTEALGSAPTTVPDFHLAAPTPGAATLLVPDSSELPTMQVTDVDHAAGTITATPLGAPGMPSMTLPLDQVQAAHDESGSPALTFLTGGAAGALSSLTVVALATRKLRKA